MQGARMTVVGLHVPNGRNGWDRGDNTVCCTDPSPMRISSDLKQMELAKAAENGRVRQSG